MTASRILLRAGPPLAAWLLALGLGAARTRADDPAYVHVVRGGETLASIAQRHYGNPRRESVLVAENGLDTQGGASIVVGLRLVVPTVGYHRVRAGETWAEIAQEHYGDVARSYALQEANPTVEAAQPPEGAELLVPYPLRHVAAQSDTLERISELYYGTADRARDLRRFNDLTADRLQRGQVILVPLPDLLLSEEGRARVASATGTPLAGGEVRALQARIETQLPGLLEHLRRGRYTETVALGNRLLGRDELTGNQIVTIERALAVAYVALARDDLATRAFAEALTRQPDLELDSRRTSPTVLRAFERARAQRAAMPAQGNDAAQGDAAQAGAAPVDAVR